ncbi:MAG: glycosyltransferase family 2 protein [Bacteroidia bacterium]
MTELSIIIPTFNRENIIKNTIIELVKSIKNINAEIIIINDGNKDFKLSIDDARIKIFNNKGKGAAAARNTGAQLATSDIILFLDDDIILSEVALKTLLSYTLKNPQNIYLTNWEYPGYLLKSLKNHSFGRYLINKNLTNLKGWAKINVTENDSLIELPNGASYCLMIHKNVFFKVGGYNQQFPYAGAEDFEFCQRLKTNGIKFYLIPNITVLHNESDRTELINWLERKERDSLTKRILVGLGYTEYQINYSLTKSFLLRIIYHTKSVYLFTLKFIPNIYFFDALYFKLVDIILASYIYYGYNKKYEK